MQSVSSTSDDLTGLQPDAGEIEHRAGDSNRSVIINLIRPAQFALDLNACRQRVSDDIAGFGRAVYLVLLTTRREERQRENC